MDGEGMHVDVWSDVICPWCYLGKRRFESALARLPWADEVEVRWRAFQLDPRAGREPGDLKAAIERKYGPGAFDSMSQRLSALGKGEGIDYRFDLAQRVSTFDAHRLLAWAWNVSGADRQGQLKERLLRAYFEEGANVADPESLQRFATEAGLDADEAGEILTSGAYADEVADDLEGATERGLTGVPAFVVEGAMMVPGAQEVQTFEIALERARERLAARSPGQGPADQ